MYELHEEVKTPSDEKIIWRYLSTEKYIDLLYRKKLYLCRLDKLNDPWEGMWTDEYIRRNPYAWECLCGEDGLINEIRKWYFVCCWHLAEHESVAMWKIYSSEHAGVAIKTTVGKLKYSLLDENQQIHIGVVEYIDDHLSYPENDRNSLYWGGISEVCKKRRIFEYEKEVRLIECNQKSPENSYVNVDLQFIDEIRLSPLIEDAIVDSIKALSDNFGINPDLINKSKIYNNILKSYRMG